MKILYKSIHRYNKHLFQCIHRVTRKSFDSKTFASKIIFKLHSFKYTDTQTKINKKYKKTIFF